MTYIGYFKLQAKSLFKDYKTKQSYFDEAIQESTYQYTPTYFDIDTIICDFDVDEDEFSLMKAQHIIALMAGFRKWTEMLKASETELELSKQLFDNQDKIFIEDWKIYIAGLENDSDAVLDAEAKLRIFNEVVLNWETNDNSLPDYRLHGRNSR